MVKYKRAKAVVRYNIFNRIFFDNYLLKYGLDGDKEDMYLVFLLGQNTAYHSKATVLFRRNIAIRGRMDRDIKRLLVNIIKERCG